MPWARFDDRYDDNPKVKRAWQRSRAAVGLHTMAVTYANRHELNGIVDREWIEEKLPTKKERDAVCDVLLDVGLFHEHPDGYEIHDFLEFNASREQIRERRAKDRARKDSGRRPKGSTLDPERIPNGIQTDPTGTSRAPAGAGWVGLGEDGSADGSQGDGAVDARELFDYWREKCRHPNAKFDSTRRTKVVARLREGFTAEQIRTAIDGAARAAFVNDQGVKHDDLELICRSAAKLEGFIARATAQPKSSPKTERRLEWLGAGT